ncbi:hypothetical protein EON68_02955, partial [archaeon]
MRRVALHCHVPRAPLPPPRALPARSASTASRSEPEVLGLLAAHVGRLGALRLSVPEALTAVRALRSVGDAPHTPLPSEGDLFAALPAILRTAGGVSTQEARTALANIVATLAAERGRADTTAAARAALDGIAQDVTRALRKGSLTPRHVSLIAWAYGRHRLQPRRASLWPEIEHALMSASSAAGWSAADVCRTLWALAEAQFGGSARPITQTFATASTILRNDIGIHNLSLLDCATLADACVMAGFNDAPLMQAIAARAVELLVPYLPPAMVQHMMSSSSAAAAAAAAATAGSASGSGAGALDALSRSSSS